MDYSGGPIITSTTSSRIPDQLVTSTFKEFYDYAWLETVGNKAGMAAAAAAAAGVAGAVAAASNPISATNNYNINYDGGGSAIYISSDAGIPFALTNYSAGGGGGLGGNGTTVTLAGLNYTHGPSTEVDNDEIRGILKTTAISIILSLMILITVIGNVFVIAAIAMERNLQNVANYLVASLAVADLLVACLVMPLGALYEICGWILGPDLCDIWTSCDVLCCTASILHLVAIATDRYWVVTDVDYIHSRTSRRVFTMIFLVWFAAVIVSLAPQFGWKDPGYLERIEQQKCMVSQDVAYQVFATCCTFYVPLLVILVLYWKIYQTARRRIHRRRHEKPTQAAAARNNQSVPNPKSTSRLPFRLAKLTSKGRSTVRLVKGNSTTTVNTAEDADLSSNERKCIEVTSFYNSDENPTSSAPQITTVSHCIVVASQAAAAATTIAGPDDELTPDEMTAMNKRSPSSSDLTPVSLKTLTVPSAAVHHQEQIVALVNQVQLSMASQMTATIVATTTKAAAVAAATASATNNPHTQVSRRKETLKAKRERKAAKTLAIITGAFVVCWLPFFIMALLLPLCDQCELSEGIASFFLWLGYFNSTLNPVIYTIFSPEFRQAFKRILFGARRNTYQRSGKF